MLKTIIIEKLKLPQNYFTIFYEILFQDELESRAIELRDANVRAEDFEDQVSML